MPRRSSRTAEQSAKKQKIIDEIPPPQTEKVSKRKLTSQNKISKQSKSDSKKSELPQKETTQTDSTLISIKDGDEPDIGTVVKAKVKDNWYTAQIVKLERHGISRKYAVKGYVVIFDRDIPCSKKVYDVGSKDILLTGEQREVRYWSSGTPCMRATGVDSHAVKESGNSLKAKAQKSTTTPKSSSLSSSSSSSYSLPPTKYGGKQAARDSLTLADEAATKLLTSLKGKSPTTAQMNEVFAEIGDDWPTQDRPNVTPNGKPVTGFCLGCVFVLGGGGMQSSNISLAFPNLCKCITSWVRGSLPEKNFPFSSIQINFNYMAKRHVDGNNIGPSYIYAMGDHEGGDLWTADKYITETLSDGSTLMRSGGGEALLTCRNTWSLFNGNMEHETQPIKLKKGKKDYTRISIIVFSNNNYNILPPNVVKEMKALGFTAQSSSGEDLPYFKKYRIDKKEFTSQQNKSYIGYLMERSKKLPPPTQPGRVCIECFGLTMNRGGGWMSVQLSSKQTKEPVIYDLEPNRTGFHVIELERLPDGDLSVCSTHINNNRFNIYKDEIKEVSRFAKFINNLPQGRIVMITITDTAIAAKRPPGKDLYDALTQIGASPTIERIGYRQPFSLIGYKGMKPGTANYAMDKTKILLRMEATISSSSSSSSLSSNKKRKDVQLNMNENINLIDFSCERTDINELKLSE